MSRNLNARFSRRDTFRRGGFSLLEVAIALVIFVIGALAIVRIFPGALNVVQGSGNRNLAVNLNRGTLNKFAQEIGSVPRAIYNGVTNNVPTADDANWAAYNGSVAGTPRRNNSLPRLNISDIDDSALGKFQYIFEEGQKVRGVTGNCF
jgi:prepilin-type N-terminal cleavage/methylation domain-containing protein